MIFLNSFIQEWSYMRIDYNDCWYSHGADKPHKACLHPFYCIFNPNRVRLESMIVDLENELKSIELELNPDTYTNNNYNDLMKEKTQLMEDLEELLIFRNNIIDKEVEEYGYGLLESEKL